MWTSKKTTQDPTIFTVSVVSVPISKVLGASFLKSGSLKTNVYTLAGIIYVDVVAEWIVHGTLNMQVVGLSLSAASWLTM